MCCIRENLKFTRLDADAFVVQSDVFAALDRLRREIEDGKESFGVIFIPSLQPGAGKASPFLLKRQQSGR